MEMWRKTVICLLFGFLQVNSVPQYKWKGCENLGQCKLDTFSTPPLVILSFDGFAREYLERKIVKSLEHIAECGAKADRVYPSFPSKTFPNHYTIVTGLYPESHGITDNDVFDLELSPNLVSMKRQESEKFYGGEPIWAAYKRLTGRPAHCLFWVGCYFNHTGFMPDVSPKYNQELPDQERIDTIVNWLKMPADTRPGLITAYLHKPDSAGHTQKSREEVDEALMEVDEYIDQLMEKLYQENLLECINLVFVSDHGMQLLNRSVEVSDHIDLDGMVMSTGVIARIHRNGTQKTEDEIADELTCKIDAVKVNTKKDMPVRKHYSRTNRVGDVVLEGAPGNAFYDYKKRNASGDHGYDYILKNMHTIMFARGPAFKRNVVVPAYQNVQYMNLWLSLLGLEGAVENNGTIGFFDSIMVDPPIRENNWDTIEECDNFGSTDVLECFHIPVDEKMKLSSKLSSCPPPKSLPINANNYCWQNYCESSVIVHRNPHDCRKAVIEILTDSTGGFFSGNFSFLNMKYSIQCPLEIQQNLQFFTAGSNSMSKMADAQFEFSNDFSKSHITEFLEILEPLQSKTVEYLKQFGKLFVISGIAKDEDFDGIADVNSGPPTHFYRILITCTGSWLSTNPPLCKKNEMKALAFVFPLHLRSTLFECMTSDAVLLDYTATIFDVEQIAGFQFQIGAFTPQQNIYLRRNVTTSLW